MASPRQSEGHLVAQAQAGAHPRLTFPLTLATQKQLELWFDNKRISDTY